MQVIISLGSYRIRFLRIIIGIKEIVGIHAGDGKHISISGRWQVGVRTIRAVITCCRRHTIGIIVLLNFVHIKVVIQRAINGCSAARIVHNGVKSLDVAKAINPTVGRRHAIPIYHNQVANRAFIPMEAVLPQPAPHNKFIVRVNGRNNRTVHRHLHQHPFTGFIVSSGSGRIGRWVIFLCGWQTIIGLQSRDRTACCTANFCHCVIPNKNSWPLVFCHRAIVDFHQITDLNPFHTGAGVNHNAVGSS
ncbi:MAG: hypothetical protein D6816_17725, partial [Bacteroidetes bacterium]